MSWVKTHRKAAIWLGALLAVGVVFLLRSRSTAATAAAQTAQNPSGTVSGVDPTGTYATGYDSGFSAGLGSVGGGGGTGVVATPTPPGKGGGTSTSKGNRIAQLLKDLAKPGLSAARRLQLMAVYHQVTGRPYSAKRNPYLPGHKKQPPHAPTRKSGHPTFGAGSGTIARPTR